jgi:SET domain-containing protein
MTRESLLEELRNNMYVSLQPSAVHGIGVFAIRDIPKGCRNIFSADAGEWIRLGFDEVEQLPAHSKEFIETYYLFDDTHYFIPSHGCKVMDMASYLNHSSTPNIISVDEGRFFEAVRDIGKGEELLVNYGTIAEVDGY